MYKKLIFLVLFILIVKHNAKGAEPLIFVQVLDSLRNTSGFYAQIQSENEEVLIDSIVITSYSNPEKSIAYSVKVLDLNGEKINVEVINALYNIASQMIYQGLEIKHNIVYLESILEDVKDEYNKNLLQGHIALLKAISSDIGEDHVAGIKLDQKAIFHYAKVRHPNIIRAYGGLALLSNEMKFYEESLKYYDIMFDLFEEYPNYENKILLMTNYVIMIVEQPHYHQNKDLLKKGIEVNNQIFELLEEKYIKRNFLWATINKYELDKLSGNNPENTLDELMILLDDINNYETQCYFYRLLGSNALHIEPSDITKALFFAQKATRIAEENNSLEHGFYGNKLLSEVYYFSNDIHKMRRAELKSDSLYNQLHLIENRELVANYGVSLDLKNLELENVSIEKDLFRQRVFIVIGSIVLLLLSLLLMSFKKRLKLFEALKESEQSLKKINSDLHEKNLIIKEQKKSLKEANEKLNNELKMSLMMLGNYEDSKNKVKVLIKKKQKLTEDSIEMILEILDNTNNEEIIQNINFKMLETNKAFYTNLTRQFPNLTENNVKLCILLKLQLGTKEIASLLFRTPESIKVAKSRLRKIFGLTDKTVKLHSFLARFELDNE